MCRDKRVFCKYCSTNASPIKTQKPFLLARQKNGFWPYYGIGGAVPGGRRLPCGGSGRGYHMLKKCIFVLVKGVQPIPFIWDHSFGQFSVRLATAPALQHSQMVLVCMVPMADFTGTSLMYFVICLSCLCLEDIGAVLRVAVWVSKSFRYKIDTAPTLCRISFLRERTGPRISPGPRQKISEPVVCKLGK